MQQTLSLPAIAPHSTALFQDFDGTLADLAPQPELVRLADDLVPLVRLLERCDAFRKPARFDEALLACECDARGRLGHHDAAYPQRQRLMQALHTAQSVDTSQVAGAAQAAGADGRQIGEKIHGARVAAVAAWIAADIPTASPDGH